jgi:hypothetical protein
VQQSKQKVQPEGSLQKGENHENGTSSDRAQSGLWRDDDETDSNSRTKYNVQRVVAKSYNVFAIDYRNITKIHAVVLQLTAGMEGVVSEQQDLK